MEETLRRHAVLLASVAACIGQIPALAPTASFAALGQHVHDGVMAAGLDEIISLSVNDRGGAVLTVTSPQTMIDYLSTFASDARDLGLYFDDNHGPVQVPLTVDELTELGLAVGMARAATVDDMKVFTAAIIRAQTGVDDHRRIAFVPGAGIPFAAVAAMALGRPAHVDL